VEINDVVSVVVAIDAVPVTRLIVVVVALPMSNLATSDVSW